MDALRIRPFDTERLVVGLGMAGTALVAAYALVTGHERLAIVVSVLPLLAWFVNRPTFAVVVLGASIPAVASITGAGEYSTGYKAAVGDVLIVLVAAGIFFRWSMSRSEPIVSALRPVALPVAQYCAFMVLLLAFHPGVRDLLKTGQRYELFLLPLVIGAFAALTNVHIRVLKAYVIAASVLAVVWPFNNLGLQHNPAGQFIANAILLLIGVRALRSFAPALLFLVPGLILTVSRGAIAATAIGIVVILVMQRAGSRPLLTRLIPIVLVGIAAFALAPSAIQSRITTISSGTTTHSQYSIYLRQQLSSDAHRIIDAHPWTGVGIGNYFAADSLISTMPAQDPHQVLLLQEAEGGYIFAASFLLLLGGTVLAMRRIKDVDLAPAAIGILLATVAHGLVDVYWVRGTPVLGWLLVGMACGQLVQRQRNAVAAEAQ